jgi:hypothetical protein
MEQSNFYTMRLLPENAAKPLPPPAVFVKLLTIAVKVEAHNEIQGKFF